MLTVTKRSAARAEIEGAVLCIGSSNFLAAEVLASAAIDVIAGVSRAAGLETYTDRFYDHIKPENLNEVRKIMRKPYNFLKHSDRDKDTAIDRYDPDTAIWRLFMAIIDYEVVWKQLSFKMAMYISWFYSQYPKILKEDAIYDPGPFEGFYGRMAELTRPAALAVLKRIIAELDGNEHLVLASEAIAATGRIEP